ncbi:MAG: DnaD domain protein [Chloroflexi bacterium]|nr:DnaD domain protein [Chloroflexota bacterium]
MKRFEGFRDGPVRWVSLPEPFFSELLPAIDDLGELKLSLYVMWALGRQEGEPRCLLRADLVADPVLREALAEEGHEGSERLEHALERAVARGVLLRGRQTAGGAEVIFLNTARGRAAAEGLERGDWQPETDRGAARPVHLERPNIFALYEENIGALTPVMADILRDAEHAYPAAWIEEAIRLAVESNARSWRALAAILDRWKTEGRGGQEPGAEKGGRRYVEGEFKEYLEH